MAKFFRQLCFFACLGIFSCSLVANELGLQSLFTQIRIDFKQRKAINDIIRESDREIRSMLLSHPISHINKQIQDKWQTWFLQGGDEQSLEAIASLIRKRERDIDAARSAIRIRAWSRIRQELTGEQREKLADLIGSSRNIGLLKLHRF